MRLFAGLRPQLELALWTERGDSADDLGTVLAPGQHPAPLQSLTSSISGELTTRFVIVTSGVETAGEAWRDIAQWCA